MGGNAWWREVEQRWRGWVSYGISEDMFHEALGGSWGIEQEIILLQRSETMDLRGLRHRNMTGAVIPTLIHRILSELHS